MKKRKKRVKKRGHDKPYYRIDEIMSAEEALVVVKELLGNFSEVLDHVHNELSAVEENVIKALKLLNDARAELF